MSPVNSYHVEILRSELQRRQKKNSSYSLRGFALYLGIDASALCRILAGKQELSVRASEKIIPKLGLAPDVANEFCVSVLEAKLRRDQERLQRLQKRGEAPAEQDTSEVGAGPSPVAALGRCGQPFSRMASTL